MKTNGTYHWKYVRQIFVMMNNVMAVGSSEEYYYTIHHSFYKWNYKLFSKTLVITSE